MSIERSICVNDNFRNWWLRWVWVYSESKHNTHTKAHIRNDENVIYGQKQLTIYDKRSVYYVIEMRRQWLWIWYVENCVAFTQCTLCETTAQQMTFFIIIWDCDRTKHNEYSNECVHFHRLELLDCKVLWGDLVNYFLSPSIQPHHLKVQLTFVILWIVDVIYN